MEAEIGEPSKRQVLIKNTQGRSHQKGSLIPYSIPVQ